ncbi:type VI secretion system contractile sheath large subunit [Pantoea sp. LS15]|uniref:type VI secretion system contractile sheath large subunit n=1 Tax=Enterobacterales TaxID=91347 RepID=UPI000E0E353B|nr:MULTISPECIES: type VI secretion system contractile sheath large subunit [Enterobacterales]NJQ21794.1 type VI secretion system contractile sheath large subunit [Pantoea sp. LS15]NKF48390.1 type VI secretion system contractile sheath large subunit [Pantoea sp. LS15]RDK12948.1 type VI secretion system contractile sheath large subunit [Enterobacter sp. 9-2]
MSTQTENEINTSATVELAADDFNSLLKREFRPKTSQLQNAVEHAVQTLSQYALRHTELIVEDTQVTIESLIAEIDKKLSAQVNAILHHEKFIQLESAWRGLHFLVSNTETDEMQKIRFLNVSKRELYLDLRKYKGVAWDQSPLFKKVYEQEYGQFGGEPYGALIADFYFDHSPQDVALLSAMAKIASAAHAPLISAVEPSVMMMESWQELANPREISKLFMTPDYAAWRDFRASEDARYVGLTLPRFLARIPYGASTAPVEDFHFEETTEGKAENFVWANSAYAMAVNINRSFKAYGWCSRIRGVESGGAIDGLPVYTFPSADGGIDTTCPTEIAISDRRELELAKSGFMPLIYRKNSTSAVFIGAQSLHAPQEYDDPHSTANANLAARLPYLFATCRFAHYLKCIVRDKVGSFKTREDMESWLNNWINQYVEYNPATASDEDKARKPLAGAQVVVEEDERNPGYYRSKFFLQPHYQLEGLTVSLRLTAKLPSAAS